MHQDSSASETSDKEIDLVRTQFNVNTDHDGNLIPISMFKPIFPRCTNADIDRSVNQKIKGIEYLMYTTIRHMQSENNTQKS